MTQAAATQCCPYILESAERYMAANRPETAKSLLSGPQIGPQLSKSGLEQLSRAHLATIAGVCDGRLRDDDPHPRARQIRRAARGWAEFWQDRLDLDALAWEVDELLGDITIADTRIGRAADQAERRS